MRTRRLLTIGVLIGLVTGAAVVAGASAEVSAEVRLIHQSTSIISTADGDLFADLNEEVNVAVAIRNVGTATATGITATIGTSTVQYPDLAPGGAATNATPFVIKMSSVRCGDGDPERMTVRTAQGSFAMVPVIPVSAVLRSESWTSTTPVDIPDGSIVNAPLTLGVGPMLTILDLNVRINDLSHTWDADLAITVLNPQSYGTTLASRRGFGADFRNTVFDDEANTSLAEGSPPFTGTFRPDDSRGTLGVFDGLDATGTWRLNIFDLEESDTGRLNSWSIDAVTARCNEEPTASFAWSPLPAIVGKPVTFTAHAVDRDGQIASHAWDFDGDGEFDDATGRTARRTFSKTGLATVGLRVVDDLGNARIVNPRRAAFLRVVRVCQVPRVVGRSLARARRAIIRAGCRVGRVRRARSRRVGRVISQRPRGGVQRPLRTRVNLVVGSR